MAPPKETTGPCIVCHGTGWLPLATGHTAGCWAIRLLTGEE